MYFKIRPEKLFMNVRNQLRVQWKKYLCDKRGRTEQKVLSIGAINYFTEFDCTGFYQTRKYVLLSML